MGLSDEGGIGGYGNSHDTVWPVPAENVSAVVLALKLLQNLLAVLAIGQASNGHLSVLKSDGRKVQNLGGLPPSASFSISSTSEQLFNILFDHRGRFVV